MMIICNICMHPNTCILEILIICMYVYVSHAMEICQRRSFFTASHGFGTPRGIVFGCRFHHACNIAGAGILWFLRCHFGPCWMVAQWHFTCLVPGCWMVGFKMPITIVIIVIKNNVWHLAKLFRLLPIFASSKRLADCTSVAHSEKSGLTYVLGASGRWVFGEAEPALDLGKTVIMHLILIAIFMKFIITTKIHVVMTIIPKSDMSSFFPMVSLTKHGMVRSPLALAVLFFGGAWVIYGHVNRHNDGSQLAIRTYQLTQ